MADKAFYEMCDAFGASPTELYDISKDDKDQPEPYVSPRMAWRSASTAASTSYSYWNPLIINSQATSYPGPVQGLNPYHNPVIKRIP